jgi:hypothetical protein
MWSSVSSAELICFFLRAASMSRALANGSIATCGMESSLSARILRRGLGRVKRWPRETVRIVGSLDHLVGSQQQRLGDRESERLRRPVVVMQKVQKTRNDAR